MNIRTIVIIYLIILPVLLFWAIIGPPSWYYQILKWIILCLFTYASYIAMVLNNATLGLFLLVIVIFYNPIFPFYLDKLIWICLDVLAIMGSVSFFIYNKYSK